MSDEVVVLDPDNCEELLLGVDSIVILPPSSQSLVTSVNGQTGPVVLGAADVGADQAGTAALLIAQITAASIGAATATQGAKADAALAAIDAPAAVRDTALTGLSTATATPITSADTVLSAAAKLQAQINAGGGAVGGFYVAGIEYNQDINAASTVATTTTCPADMLSLYPMQVIEDVVINQYALITGNVSTTSNVKLAIYEAALSGSSYTLTRITGQTIVDVSRDSAKFNLPTSASLKSGKLYFFGLIADSSGRNFRAIPVSSAKSLGYAVSNVSALKTTLLRIAFPRNNDLPLTINTAGFTADTTPPIEFRFRVASA